MNVNPIFPANGRLLAANGGETRGDAMRQALYMPDGLHYSPAGYERLAHRIAAGLTAVCR